MRKTLKTIAAASALIVGLAAVPVLYAQEGSSGVTGGGSMMNQGSGGTMQGSPGGMMGHMMGQMGQMAPKGSGGMMQGGPGGMMGQMGQMAENCNAMRTSMMPNHGMAPSKQ